MTLKPKRIGRRAPRKKAEKAAGVPKGRELALAAAELAFDKKAVDVLALDVTGQSPLADFMVIATGRSSTQVGAVAGHIEDELAKRGARAVGKERGHKADPSWVLLDYFDVVVHVMDLQARSYYRLESLYKGAKTLAQYH